MELVQIYFEYCNKLQLIPISLYFFCFSMFPSLIRIQEGKRNADPDSLPSTNFKANCPDPVSSTWFCRIRMRVKVHVIFFCFRRGTSDLVDPDLASSPLITGGDPDSDSNKYKRRGPTDLLYRSVTYKLQYSRILQIKLACKTVRIRKGIERCINYWSLS